MSAPDEEVSEPMSPALFPARSSVLADAALADYAAHAFALDPPVACLFFQWDDNDTHLVTAGDGIQRFLRVSRLGKRSLAAAEAEAEIVARLADAGVPVARPLRRRDGRYSQELLAAEGPPVAN